MASVAVVSVRISKKVYDSPEELNLVRRAMIGDAEAFRQLHDAHHNRVFLTINRMLADDDISLWVANIALVKVWKGLAKFKEQSKFSTWVTRIAINEARMYLRTEKRRHQEVSLDALLSDTASSSNEPMVTAHRFLAHRDLNLAGVDDRLVLERAIDCVPEQFREILRLRFWEGMSMEEIQAKISMDESEPVSIPAVKSRILRGRNFLMEQVERIS